MPATSAPPAAKATDWPGYHFARLEEALHAGDFDKAADAARHLRRLGVDVRYPRPVLDSLAPAPAGGWLAAR